MDGRILPSQSSAHEIQLIAGPPAATPPLPVAILIVLLSLAAPFLFLRAGHPSLWLTSAAFALACAGIVAIEAQAKRHADRAIRARATISPSGISFLPTPARPSSHHFSRDEIKHVHLLATALIVHTTEDHAAPGRHVLRFGRLASWRDQLLQSLQSLNLSD